MAYPVKALATKPDDPSLVPETPYGGKTYPTSTNCPVPVLHMAVQAHIYVSITE